MGAMRAHSVGLLSDKRCGRDLRLQEMLHEIFQCASFLYTLEIETILFVRKWCPIRLHLSHILETPRGTSPIIIEAGILKAGYM